MSHVYRVNTPDRGRCGRGASVYNLLTPLPRSATPSEWCGVTACLVPNVAPRCSGDSLKARTRRQPSPLISDLSWDETTGFQIRDRPDPVNKSQGITHKPAKPAGQIIPPILRKPSSHETTPSPQGTHHLTSAGEGGFDKVF